MSIKGRRAAMPPPKPAKGKTPKPTRANRPIMRGRRGTAKQKQPQQPPCTAAGCVNESTGQDGLCDECRKEIEDDKLRQRQIAAETRGVAQRRGTYGQYAVEWNVGQTFFKFEAQDEVSFYGWYRKTRFGGGNGQLGHAIDLFAKVGDKDLSVDSVLYETDPRGGMPTLNADICAMANRWFFDRLNGDVESLKQLAKQAKRPTIYINRFETLDRLILSLRETRKTAVVSGGSRIIELIGDRDDKDVVMVIHLNLQAQALVLEGKVPTLRAGMMYDRVLVEPNAEIDTTKINKKANQPATTDTGGKPNRPQRMPSGPVSKGNLEALKAELVKAKSAGDQKAQRRIRSAMRAIGHAGGLREGTSPPSTKKGGK